MGTWRSGRDQPPALSRCLLEWASRRLLTPELADDAAELFREKACRDGAPVARRWYRRQARAAVGRIVRRRGRVFRLPAPGVSWLDIKLAARMLLRQPGLTFVAVFALAIGIPVGLLPLHVLDALTRPLPVPDGERVVIVRNYDRETLRANARPLHDFTRWRAQLSSFEDLAIWRTALYNVGSQDGRPAPVRGIEATASTFSILRVPPMLGRPLEAADEVAGAPDVVVISHDLWRSRLAGDPEVVGSAIRIGGVPHTVVGVMPDGFLFPFRDQLWLPFRHDPLDYERGTGPAAQVAGRLADGVSLETARTEIELLGRRMAGELPETHGNLHPQVLPFTDALTEMDSLEARMGIFFTQVLAFLLLGLACGNVGILILARSATRTRELAIRTALGASRTRILAQLFVESLVLAVLAAGVGLVGLQAVATGPDYLVAGLPYWVDFEVSVQTALFALSLAVVSAAIAGLVPGLKATGKRVQASMHDAAGGAAGIRFGRGYSALIVAEVAVSVWFLAVGSALLPTVVSKPAGLGIATEQYLHASVRMPQADPNMPSAGFVRPDADRRVAVLHQELIRRLSAEPGLGAVAIANALPGMSHDTRLIEVEGVPLPRDSPLPAHPVQVARVDAGYFDALDQPILSGRNFNRADLGDDRSAVIVNAGFVERVLGGRNPLGRRLRYWSADRDAGAWAFEIVGVVGPLGMNPLNDAADQGLYHVAAPGELHPVSLAVRTGNDPEGFTARLRSIVSAIDASALIQDPMPLNEVPDANRRILTLITYLVASLAGIALLLSAACLYALMSFTVAERTRECGIRTALGARPANIVSVIGRRAFVQLAVGVSIGAALGALILSELAGRAAAITRTGNWQLTVALIALAALAVGMLACARPLVRLVRIRPVDALRI